MCLHVGYFVVIIERNREATRPTEEWKVTYQAQHVSAPIAFTAAQLTGGLRELADRVDTAAQWRAGLPD